MSNETSTTSLAGLTNSSLVQRTIIFALSEKPGQANMNCREFNLVGQPTNAAKIATETSFWGTPNDHGAGVATAFNGTEATAFGNTQYAAGNVTCTAAEYGVAAAMTDNTGEDLAVDGAEVLNLLQGRMLLAMTLAMDSDYFALYSGLSQGVGTSGAALTVAQTLAAQQGIRQRGADADRVKYVIGNKHASDLEGALIATSTSMAVFALAADRLLNYAPGVNNGMGSNRQIMSFRGYEVVASGILANASGTTDEVGACFVPTSAYNDAQGSTTHGAAWKRLPRFETQRQAKLRATDVVMSARWGVTELQDGSGTNITARA